MVRLMAARLMLVLSLVGLPLQGMAGIAMLGCLLPTGNTSASTIDSDMSGDNMGVMDPCKNFKLGAHGAAGCQVCSSCSLCPAGVCLDTRAGPGMLAWTDSVATPIDVARSIFFPPLKHPPRPTSLLG